MNRGTKLLCALFVLYCCSIMAVKSKMIYGVWSPWAAYSEPCSKSCGGGIKRYYRSCTNPAPQEGGLNCLAVDGIRKDIEIKIETCNNQSCWKDTWSDWSACEPACKVNGSRYKVAVCGNEPCKEDQAKKIAESCNGWNKTACPSPCQSTVCPEYANCVDLSDELKPMNICVCTMGYMMNEKRTACIRPAVTTTERPIPSLAPPVKMAVTVVTKTASIVLIIFVSITLLLFIFMRVYTPDRVIQMNMEIALLAAHLFLLFPSSITDVPALCRLVSVALHFFFTACFFFVMLDSLHMFAFVGQVVKKDGLLTRVQYVLCGWGISFVIVLLSVCFEYDHYGASYHCWLRMDTALMIYQVAPVIIMVIITFIVIEAAGADEIYKPLSDIDAEQLSNARYCQRTNLIILPLVLGHWLLGMLSEYQQDLPMYGTFSILSGVLGGTVFVLHCYNHCKIRGYLKKKIQNMCGGNSKK